MRDHFRGDRLAWGSNPEEPLCIGDPMGSHQPTPLEAAATPVMMPAASDFARICEGIPWDVFSFSESGAGG